MTAAAKTLRVLCLDCSRRTNHEILQEHETSDYSEPYDIHAGKNYRIIRCLGCEAISFQEETWCSEDVDPETGDLDVSETLFPSRTGGRAAIKAADVLPTKVLRIYEETIKTFNADVSVLTAVGLRAVVEAVCIDLKCAGGDLEKKIDALVSNGVLAKKQADSLHLHRFMGNEAAHEMDAPPLEELTSALDIIENLLKTIYELPRLAADFKALRERRGAKTTK